MKSLILLISVALLDICFVHGGPKGKMSHSMHKNIASLALQAHRKQNSDMLNKQHGAWYMSDYKEKKNGDLEVSLEAHRTGCLVNVVIKAGLLKGMLLEDNRKKSR